jgi:pyruvate,water dikinase
MPSNMSSVVAAGEVITASFENAIASETAHAGGKGASLSRIANAGLPVPRGFVVCTGAFREFLESTNGVEFVDRILTGLDVHSDRALADAAAKIQDLICSNPLPPRIARAIRDAYEDLGSEAVVAVRSSAIAEDGEGASFAGQQETFLNVRSAAMVECRVKECWASFFAPRAIFYRQQKGTLTDTRMAVVVQEMVLAAKSGVMFTIDPVMKRRDHMVIEAVFGLGEGIVSGLITPDQYVLDREVGSVVREFISTQPVAVVPDLQAGGITHRELSEQEGSARVLSEGQLNALREMGLRIEAFFGAPQDVEWCIRDSDLLLLQSRPITTL